MTRLILAVFATYRLSQLVAWDNGPGFIFHKLRTWTKFQYDTQSGAWENLDEAVNCPYCLGVWFAGLTMILYKYPSRVGDFFLLWLGIAGGQAFLQGITKGR